MFNTFLTIHGAAKVVNVCAAVKPGERVLIVTDAETAAVAEAVATAAHLQTSEVAVMLIPPGRVDGGEPPPLVRAAMLETDVIVAAVSRSISHSTAVNAALANGARMVSLAGFRPEDLVRGGIEADFLAQRVLCDRVADRLGDAETARLTSDAGTDLLLRLGKRPANSHPGIADRPGQFTAVPNIEANIAPIENESQGVIVFDGSIPNLRTGRPLGDPVMVHVKGGSIVAIEGGAEAALLKRIWNEQDDPTVYTVAQLAVGLNPRCTGFTGGFLNDHGVFGSVHIGIGTSMNLGGDVKAPLHFDGMLRAPRLELDGQVVVEDWNVMIGDQVATAGTAT